MPSRTELRLRLASADSTSLGSTRAHRSWQEWPSLPASLDKSALPLLRLRSGSGAQSGEALRGRHGGSTLG